MSYRVALALLIFACAVPARAGIEFGLYAGGQPLPGGEVCFFKTAGQAMPSSRPAEDETERAGREQRN